MILFTFLMLFVGMALIRPNFRTIQGGSGRQFEQMILDQLKPSGAVTVDADTDSVDLEDRRNIELFLDATASAGSPTLDVTVQHSHDNTTFVTLGTFTQVTGVTSERKTFSGCRRYLRYHLDIGGTGGPSITCSITGNAH